MPESSTTRTLLDPPIPKLEQAVSRGCWPYSLDGLMPISPPRPCAQTGCRVLVYKGSRCELHRKEQRRTQAQRREHGPRVYDKRIWRDRIRPAQLRRQPLCEHCLVIGIAKSATDVDHIDGNPMNNDTDNLQSLCHACHSIKTAAHDGSFGR